MGRDELYEWLAKLTADLTGRGPQNPAARHDVGKGARDVLGVLQHRHTRGPLTVRDEACLRGQAFTLLYDVGLPLDDEINEAEASRTLLAYVEAGVYWFDESGCPLALISALVRAGHASSKLSGPRPPVLDSFSYARHLLVERRSLKKMVDPAVLRVAHHLDVRALRAQGEDLDRDALRQRITKLRRWLPPDWNNVEGLNTSPALVEALRLADRPEEAAAELARLRGSPVQFVNDAQVAWSEPVRLGAEIEHRFALRSKDPEGWDRALEELVRRDYVACYHRDTNLMWYRMLLKWDKKLAVDLPRPGYITTAVPFLL